MEKALEVKLYKKSGLVWESRIFYIGPTDIEWGGHKEKKVIAPLSIVHVRESSAFPHREQKGAAFELVLRDGKTYVLCAVDERQKKICLARIESLREAVKNEAARAEAARAEAARAKLAISPPFGVAVAAPRKLSPRQETTVAAPVVSTPVVAPVVSTQPVVSTKVEKKVDGAAVVRSMDSRPTVVVRPPPTPGPRVFVAKVRIPVTGRSQFGVVARVEGVGRRNIEYVEDETGCKVTVRGKDCGNPEYESEESLHVRIEGKEQTEVARAEKLVANLRETVVAEYKPWAKKRNSERRRQEVLDEYPTVLQTALVRPARDSKPYELSTDDYPTELMTEEDPFEEEDEKKGGRDESGLDSLLEVYNGVAMSSVLEQEDIADILEREMARDSNA